MKFLAMNDDVKFIIFKHLASDLKARSIISKYHDLQEILFGDVVYNDDLCTYFSLQYNAKENDDFKNAKIFKYIKISHIQEISYIMVALVIH